MNKTKKLNLLILTIAIISVVAYIFLWYITTDLLITKDAFMKIIKRRSYHVLAMAVAAILIAFASLSFQTITNNRLLTPSMIGFDAIFIATQTFLIFIFGQNSKLFANAKINFLISASLMVLLSLLLYSFILKRNKNQIFVLLLVGMVISTLVRSVTGFIQRIMDPNALDAVLSAGMVSITNINTSIVIFVLPLMLLLIVLFYRKNLIYDTMSLGEDMAINLGVNYHKETNTTMIYIALSMAVATALIGPITFLGLLVVNLVRELFGTYYHRIIMISSALIAVVTIVLGQLIVEIFNLGVPVTIIINLVGGAYMMYLIWKVNNKWLQLQILINPTGTNKY